MQIACDRRRVVAEQESAVLVLDSEARLKTAENDAKALEASAQAENNSTAGLEYKRKYELEWQRLSVLERLARQGRRFISGEIGSNVLGEMVPSATSFASQKAGGKAYF